MSEKGNRRQALLEKYEAMTTEELKHLLRQDSEAPDGTDTEEVLCIMEVLAGRNKENTGNRAQKVWESFQRDYLPEIEEKSEQKKSVPWWRPLATAAAVLVLLIGVTMTVDAFGWADIWGAVVNWAKETFSFVSSNQPQLDEPVSENDVEYETFEKAIFDMTGQANLVPTYIPDGFVLDKIRIEETPENTVFLGSFSNGGRYFRVQVKPYIDEKARWFEKSGETLEVYTHLEAEYYIFANLKQHTAVWLKDSYECTISGDLSVEEIKMMIKSIGKG